MTELGGYLVERRRAWNADAGDTVLKVERRSRELRDAHERSGIR